MTVGSANGTNNITNTPVEAFFDKLTKQVAEKVQALRGHIVGSIKNKDLMEQANLVASVVAAIVIGFSSPLVVGGFTLLGTVVRALSKEELVTIQNNLSDSANSLPFGIKIFGFILAKIYTPIALPALVGLNAGFEIGAKVRPQFITGTIQQAADAIRVEDNKGADSK